MKKTIELKQKVGYARLTFTLPQSVAKHILALPSQKRSQEVTAILEEEFSRRQLVKTIDTLAKQKPLIPQTYKPGKVKKPAGLGSFVKNLWK